MNLDVAVIQESFIAKSQDLDIKAQRGGGVAPRVAFV